LEQIAADDLPMAILTELLHYLQKSYIMRKQLDFFAKQPRFRRGPLQTTSISRAISIFKVGVDEYKTSG
jgi:hypothetical protein